MPFGASTRGTALPRPMDDRSDIDYMIVFGDNEPEPQAYINRLIRFVIECYDSSEIAQSHPTVVLTLDQIDFDLVPAIKSNTEEYCIPARSNGYTDWVATAPAAFNARLSSKNRDCNDNLIPAICMLKYWNALSGHVYDSYSLEEWSVDQDAFASATAKDHFFSLVEELSIGWSAARWRKDKVEYAKHIVARTKEYEQDGLPAEAEAEIRKLVP